jgi:prolyl-tRNA editing enzyme YbaK/EbsC (Cys-tRNA(Pro) deacylase)
MSLEKAREYLKTWNKDGEILEFPVSSATVELAAQALNTEEGRIAKSLSFAVDNRAVLVVTAGDMKIDNQKYKSEFGAKAKMLAPDEVKALIGHEVGGVCPFGIPDSVEVYLDESLRRFPEVYPACGSGNSAIKLRCDELEKISKARKWVDVCKERN